jgi:hypothetical protein
MTTADFETFDKEAMSEITAKEEIDKLDHVWAERISKLPVGHGFRARRDDSESVRQFKRRLNAAAKYSFRELEWFPEQKNVKPEDVTSWVVKVRSLNVKAQQEAAAKAAMAQNGQNASQASQEGQQTTEGENPPNDTSEETTSVGPRRARSGA